MSVVGICRGRARWQRGCSLTLYTTGSLRGVSPELAVSSSVLPLSTASSPDFFSGSLEPGPPPAPGVPPYPPLLSDLQRCPGEALGCQKGAPALGPGRGPGSHGPRKRFL